LEVCGRKTTATVLDANEIVFRRADGQVVGELKVDGIGSHDIALLDAKGVVRLSVRAGTKLAD
jgi:hypothetical protein